MHIKYFAFAALFGLIGCGHNAPVVAEAHKAEPVAAVHEAPEPQVPESAEKATEKRPEPRSGTGAVTGKPYIADEKTEVTRNQSDGSPAATVTTARVYRDSQGRTRREVTSAAGTTVTISDPVAGVRYELDAAAKTAYRSEMVEGGERREPERRGGGEGNHEPGHREPEFRGEGGGREGGERERGGDGERSQRLHEDLGTQTIDGISARGSRNIRGETVDERWFSPDLQLELKSIRSSPRGGETVRTLSGIRRVEPAASLFRVPPGYKVLGPAAQ
jgi:hypothetical protein